MQDLSDGAVPPFLVLEHSGRGQDGCLQAAAPRSQLRVVLVGVVMAQRKEHEVQRCGVGRAEKSPGV